MEIILVGYIETEKFGKVAHFIENDKDVYSRVLKDDENEYYQELTPEETKELRTILEEDAGV